MKWFTRLWYDIKRLAGYGRLPILVLLSPILIMVVFSTIFIPLLSEGNGANIPFAICNEDHSEMIDIFFQYNMGKKNDIATYYPVQNMDIGMKLLQEEKISVLMHIPEDFYSSIDAGENAPIYLYYLPDHSFEATMIQINLNNNLAYLGQSQNILALAADIAREHGLSPTDTNQFLNFCIDESIYSYSRRSRIFEKNGEITATGDYIAIEYYVAALFSLCLLFSMFPTIHLTSDDLNRYYHIRKSSGTKWIIDYSVRLISGTIMNYLTLLMFLPIAYLIKKINGISLGIMKESLGYLLLCMPMLALIFSALAIMLAAMSGKTNNALWLGLYISFFMIACSGLFSDLQILTDRYRRFLQVLPFNVSMSLISNALLKFNQGIYIQNMKYLLITGLIFMIIGAYLYRKRTICRTGGII